ncbi:MAG: formylglycine-generating enzyme family protein [Variovorax sp.]
MRLPAVFLTCAAVAGCAAVPLRPAPDGIVDSVGISLVRVPAGEFSMGSAETPPALAAAFPHYDPARFAKLGDEGPVHRVRITRPFWLGRHEVTVGQFRRFVEASGHVPESEADGTGAYGFNTAYDPAASERGDAFEGRDPRYSWRNPGFAQGDDHPVVNVTWADAKAMARWLSAREGATYRLPTEAEWEYAARGGTRTRFSSGDEPQKLLGSANVFDEEAAVHWPQWLAYALSGRDGFAFTAPVGQFAPNAFGLYDMHGNVWEWCADWHADDYYARSPVDDPQGPSDGDVRVRRGGSWHTWAFYARASFRNWNTPQTRYTLLGFRLLREMQ